VPELCVTAALLYRIRGRSSLGAFELHGKDVHAIDNGGALSASGAAFVHLLGRLASS
jgi:hypothetical protein